MLSSISSPELYSTINEIEAEFPLVAKKDQTDVVFISTPGSDRNANEPDNKLSTRYPVVNDFPRVHNLANIDLRQSRVSTVVEFDADYSAIQVDTGDVVKVDQVVCMDIQINYSELCVSLRKKVTVVCSQ